MTNPYRALCAELLAALKSWSPHGGGPLECWEDREEEADLIARARALLAQPVAEEPTDRELWAAGSDDFRANCYPTDAIAYARAVLARWGHPTPQPVAVGERLPGPEDCDAEGRCWGWWTDPMSEYWEYVGVSAPIEPYGSYIPRAGHTHWLPANSLPTPEATND